MRYWGILAAKLAAATAVLVGIYKILAELYTPPPHLIRLKQQAFLHDLGWTTVMFVFNLIVFGALYLVVWDQRRRCRTCGRLLRMPVSHGRYGQILLFGRPRTEYICIYGHGTLVAPELHIGTREPANWKSHDPENIWDELYALDKSSKEDR
jgi:hypothetical protein